MIMLISLMLTSMAVVREREAGTMEQLMVTPIKPIELMLGKTIPFAVISFFDMLLITAFGVFWFNIPIHGSLVASSREHGHLPLVRSGNGPFISTIAKTQQQALMAAMFFNMPAILLSGFMFPDREYARLFPVCDLSESRFGTFSSLSGGVPEGERVRGFVAADGPASGNRHCGDQLKRAQVQKAAGITRSG